MSSEYDQRAVSFISGLLLGAVIGASVALLTTPRSGRKARRRLRRAAGSVRNRAHDGFDEIATDLRGRFDDALQGARERFVD